MIGYWSSYSLRGRSLIDIYKWCEAEGSRANRDARDQHGCFGINSTTESILEVDYVKVQVQVGPIHPHQSPLHHHPPKRFQFAKFERNLTRTLEGSRERERRGTKASNPSQLTVSIKGWPYCTPKIMCRQRFTHLKYSCPFLFMPLALLKDGIACPLKAVFLYTKVTKLVQARNSDSVEQSCNEE